jgi:ferredoxin-NADP reductase
MEKELAVGNEVWVKLPYGEFVISDTSDVVLFAGGTGITAFTAFLDQLREEQEHSISLFYGARNSGLLVYRSMIDQKAQICSKLNTRYYVENGIPQGDHEMKGKLSVAFAFSFLDKPLEKEYYLSGPPRMLKSLHADLILKEIPVKQIKIDAWE